MGKVDTQLLEECHQAALQIQEQPHYAEELLKKLDVYLDKDLDPVDQYIIYHHLYSLFTQQAKDQLLHLQTIYIESLIIPDMMEFTPSIKDLDPHIQISLFFLINIMRENKYEIAPIYLNELIKTVGPNMNIYLHQGNTPLIWSIANSSFKTIHKFLSALETQQAGSFIDIDKHCTDFCKGSALFLASLKGEMHRDDSNVPLSKDPNERMDSVIKRLIALGASPLNQCDHINKYSPLDIMILSRSPEMVKLFLDHLPQPLTSEQIVSLKRLLGLSYQQSLKIIKDLAEPYTFPSEQEWSKNNNIIEDILHNYKTIEQKQDLPKLNTSLEVKQGATPKVTESKASVFSKKPDEKKKEHTSNTKSNKGPGCTLL